MTIPIATTHPSIYALTSVAAARSYLGTVPDINGIWVYCLSPTGATAATVTVNNASIDLTITGGASAGTDSISLTAAATDTITELVTAINALTGKWIAGALCDGSTASTDLVVTGALSCLGSTNEITLQVEDNYSIGLLIDRATDVIERYCGRQFVSRSYDRQQYVGNGRETLVLNQYPVSRVFRVSEGRANTFCVTNTTALNFATVEVTTTKIRLSADGTVTDLTLSSYATINLLIAAINATSGWSATLIAEGTRCPYYTGSDGSTKVAELIPMPGQRCKSPNVAYVMVSDTEIDDYWIMAGGGDLDRDAGMLMREGGWYGGETYYIDSVCGYSATALPAALEEACLMLVKYAKDKPTHSSDVQSESLGDYSYSLRDIKAALPPDILAEVNLFRSFEF